MYRAPRSYVLLLQLCFWGFRAVHSLDLPQLSSLNRTELMDSDPVCFYIRGHAVAVRHPIQADCEAAGNELHPFQDSHPSTSIRLPMTSNCRLRKRQVLAASQ